MVFHHKFTGETPPSSGALTVCVEIRDRGMRNTNSRYLTQTLYAQPVTLLAGITFSMGDYAAELPASGIPS
jgi:hypothetical protein